MKNRFWILLLLCPVCVSLGVFLARLASSEDLNAATPKAMDYAVDDATLSQMSAGEEVIQLPTVSIAPVTDASSDQTPQPQESPSPSPTVEPSETPNCDEDGDGFVSISNSCGGADCDDKDRDVHPLAAENTDLACTDGKDNDCDGLTDCFDRECDGRAGWLPGVVTLSPTGKCCNPLPVSVYVNGSPVPGEGAGVVDRNYECNGRSVLCNFASTFTPPPLEKGGGGEKDMNDLLKQPPALPGGWQPIICRLPLIGPDGAEVHPQGGLLDRYHLLFAKDF